MIGPAALSVLFIGNSLTATHDLPRRVQEVARASGRAVEAAAVTLPGSSLDDHWQDGAALRALRGRRWDVVVLQQGPSTLPASRAELIASTRRFAAEIRKAGARPALLMVWPLPGQTQEAVAASYRAAAAATDALLLPAGEAWQAARARDPSLVLTARDGFHPSLAGAWVAALAVHCALFPGVRPALPAGGALGRDQERRVVEAACPASR